MSRNKFDISELYDFLKSKLNTYILCFDIIGLMPINDISIAAGDKAILECLKRIDEIAPEDMVLFRIGGDEFALVTGLTNKNEVELLANKIIDLNGSAINYDGKDIPVFLRAVAMIYDDQNIHCKDLLNNLHDAIQSTRNNKKVLMIT